MPKIYANARELVNPFYFAFGDKSCDGRGLCRTRRVGFWGKMSGSRRSDRASENIARRTRGPPTAALARAVATSEVVCCEQLVNALARDGSLVDA